MKRIRQLFQDDLRVPAGEDYLFLALIAVGPIVPLTTFGPNLNAAATAVN